MHSGKDDPVGERAALQSGGSPSYVAEQSGITVLKERDALKPIVSRRRLILRRYVFRLAIRMIVNSLSHCYCGSCLSLCRMTTSSRVGICYISMLIYMSFGWVNPA